MALLHLSGVQPLWMVLATPVCFLLWHVKMPPGKKGLLLLLGEACLHPFLGKCFKWQEGFLHKGPQNAQFYHSFNFPCCQSIHYWLLILREDGKSFPSTEPKRKWHYATSPFPLLILVWAAQFCQSRWPHFCSYSGPTLSSGGLTLGNIIRTVVMLVSNDRMDSSCHGICWQ